MFFFGQRPRYGSDGALLNVARPNKFKVSKAVCTEVRANGYMLQSQSQPHSDDGMPRLVVGDSRFAHG
jgi:hypothetical protein